MPVNYLHPTVRFRYQNKEDSSNENWREMLCDWNIVQKDGIKTCYFERIEC